jgi:hypothetical protein
VFLRNVGIYLRVHKASHPTTSSSFTLYSIVVNIGLYVPPALVIGNSAFCIYVFRLAISSNNINQLLFVTVKCCVLFEARAEF